MTDSLEPSVVILIGPPGAGKGTQANLLAEEFGFFHLESSKVIEGKLNSVPAGTDPILDQEREKWRTGLLNDDDLVLKWMNEAIELLANQKKSLVFSGSPRRLMEAEGETPLLEKYYGQKNIHILHLKIDEAEGIRRNSLRRVCKANRHSIPYLKGTENLETCPKDGSPLIRREGLDDPETIKVRYQEYFKTTLPVLEYFQKRGYSVVEVDGAVAIEAVHHQIIETLERRRKLAFKN